MGKISSPTSISSAALLPLSEHLETIVYGHTTQTQGFRQSIKNLGLATETHMPKRSFLIVPICFNDFRTVPY